MSTHVPECGLELRGAQGSVRVSELIAAETEPAIRGTEHMQFQQYPIAVPMHDPLDRTVGLVTDRIRTFMRKCEVLPSVGAELSHQRVIGGLPRQQRLKIGRQALRVSARQRVHVRSVSG